MPLSHLILSEATIIRTIIYLKSISCVRHASASLIDLYLISTASLQGGYYHPYLLYKEINI